MDEKGKEGGDEGNDFPTSENPLKYAPVFCEQNVFGVCLKLFLQKQGLIKLSSREF